MQALIVVGEALEDERRRTLQEAMRNASALCESSKAAALLNGGFTENGARVVTTEPEPETEPQGQMPRGQRRTRFEDAIAFGFMNRRK